MCFSGSSDLLEICFGDAQMDDLSPIIQSNAYEMLRDPNPRQKRQLHQYSSRWVSGQSRSAIMLVDLSLSDIILSSRRSGQESCVQIVTSGFGIVFGAWFQLKVESISKS